jgi:hypothetical protein
MTPIPVDWVLCSRSSGVSFPSVVVARHYQTHSIRLLIASTALCRAHGEHCAQISHFLASPSTLAVRDTRLPATSCPLYRLLHPLIASRSCDPLRHDRTRCNGRRGHLSCTSFLRRPSARMPCHRVSCTLNLQCADCLCYARPPGITRTMSSPAAIARISCYLHVALSSPARRALR